VLRRVERSSELGDWSYEVYDTKLARDARGATILQLAVYSDLLARVQGALPEYFHVVTPDPVTPLHSFRLAAFAAYYRQTARNCGRCLRRGRRPSAAPTIPSPSSTAPCVAGGSSAIGAGVPTITSPTSPASGGRTAPSWKRRASRPRGGGGDAATHRVQAGAWRARHLRPLP